MRALVFRLAEDSIMRHKLVMTGPMAHRSLLTGFLAAGLLAAQLALPSVAAAADEEPPTMVSYGVNGFFTGAPIGLAAGFLATGSKYESDEWRTLVMGAGIGALAGVGVGLTLGFVDIGREPPPVGYMVLRDMGSGMWLGAVVGAAVGALFLINSGEGKDVLTGASYGALIGTGVGIAFGVIEASNAQKKPPPAEPSAPGFAPPGSPPPAPAPPPATSGLTLHFTVVGSADSLMPLPALGGTF